MTLTDPLTSERKTKAGANERSRLVVWDSCMEASLDRYHQRFVAGVVVLFFAFHAWYLNHRQVWHDELATYYLVRTFSWTSICEALRLTVDAQPPTYHFLQIPLLAYLGDDPKNLRWLSAIAASVSLGATAVWLRRTMGSAGALGAIAMLATSELGYYAAEARPYALLIAAVSMALASRRLGWRVIWLAVAVCLHYYAVFLPFLFALNEPPWRRRAAYGLALLPLWITLPAMPPPFAMDMGGPYAPTLVSLLVALPALAGGSRYAVLLLLVAAFVVLPRRWRDHIGGDRMAWALVAMVPICWLTGEWVVGVFFRRYAVVSLLGLAGLIGWLVNRLPHRALGAVAFAILSLAGALITGPPGRWDAKATARLVDGQIRATGSAVVMGQSNFLEVYHHLPLSERSSFHRLTRQRPSFTTAYAYRPKQDSLYSEMIGKYAGFVPVGLDDWVAGHASFVVVAATEQDWVLRACRQRGAVIVPGIQNVTHRLYTVSFPAGGNATHQVARSSR